METNKKSICSGKALRNAGLVAALLLTAISLTACVVPVDRDFQGGRSRHHWNNGGDWQGNGGAGWQGNGGGDWDHHH